MNLSFGDGETAGKAIHKNLEKAGYKMLFIPSENLMKHMIHLDHATMILNPETGGRKTTKPAARRQLQKALNKIHYREILDSPMEDC